MIGAVEREVARVDHQIRALGGDRADRAAKLVDEERLAAAEVRIGDLCDAETMIADGRMWQLHERAEPESLSRRSARLDTTGARAEAAERTSAARGPPSHVPLSSAILFSWPDNPVFLCGSVGFGKTHLLHSIGHQQLANRPSARIVYLSSERLMNEYVHAIPTGRMHDVAVGARRRKIAPNDNTSIGRSHMS